MSLLLSYHSQLLVSTAIGQKEKLDYKSKKYLSIRTKQAMDSSNHLNCCLNILIV